MGDFPINNLNVVQLFDMSKVPICITKVTKRKKKISFVTRGLLYHRYLIICLVFKIRSVSIDRSDREDVR